MFALLSAVIQEGEANPLAKIPRSAPDAE